MLKFKGSYIYNSEDKEIASLVDRFPVVTGDERYAAYLYSVVDHMTPNQIREYIDAAKALETKNIVQAQMKKSLVQQLEQKLHDCLMLTDVEYQLSQYRKRVEMLEKEVAEERKKRIELENELIDLKFELKHQHQQSLHEDECESEYEN